MSPWEFDIIKQLISYFFWMIAVIGATAVAITWIKRGGKKQSVAPGLSDQLNAINNRLAQLDAAVGSVAIEVERISEAQRFTAKVLAERAPAKGILSEGSKPLGSNTPH